jgi:hypothetical protein
MALDGGEGLDVSTMYAGTKTYPQRSTDHTVLERSRGGTWGGDRPGPYP